MDIIGTGLDATEISRIADAIERYGDHFVRRVFTEGEIAYCRAKRSFAASFAARFAAKEATMKALGTGYSRGVYWTTIEVVRHHGPPTLQFHAGAAARFAKLGGTRSVRDADPFTRPGHRARDAARRADNPGSHPRQPRPARASRRVATHCRVMRLRRRPCLVAPRRRVLPLPASMSTEDAVDVKITLNDKNNPPGKLADAEIHFTDGVLDGLEADRLRRLGTPDRRRPQRHVPGAPVFRQRRAPQLFAAAARRPETPPHRTGFASWCCRPTRSTRSAPPSRRNATTDDPDPSQTQGGVVRGLESRRS